MLNSKIVLINKFIKEGFMKYLFLCCFLFSGFIFNSFLAQAAQDHVGVFHRMEKVIVLINEPAGGRLDQMLEALNHRTNDYKIKWLSSDGTFKLSCGRGDNITGCTIRFLPTSNIAIGPRDVTLEIDLHDLGIFSSENFEMYFESAQQDKFTMSIQNNVLRIYATKRNGYSSLSKMCPKYLN